MVTIPDDTILQILTQEGRLMPAQCKLITEKVSEKRKNLRQIHSVNVNGVMKEIEHPVTMIDIIASMALPYKGNAMGILDEEEIVRTVASSLKFNYRRIDPLKLDLELVTKTIPHLFALQHLVVPVAKSNGTLEVVMYNPGDRETIEDIVRVTNMNISPFMGTKQDILKTVREFFGFKISITAAESLMSRPSFDLSNLEQYTKLGNLNELHTNDAHIKNAVDYLFHYAFDQRASDIHIEPRRKSTVIRLRIDGVLHTIYELPKALHPAITSRIKTLSRMDIAEKRRPQDGRIKVFLEKDEAEIRVSTVPVAFGEKTVLRILDPTVLFQDIQNLGFSKKDINIYKQFIQKTHGIILVTGPTGSGKSTTLYSSLGAISTPEVNITTVEDPIEMVHEAFNQIAVQPTVGITFSSILRNILRQDPDIIMIGEMRDQETAENAIQASLTGHLVLSTLHTNDAPSSITRLVNLGIKPYLIAESLIGVIAQRLVRKICPFCVETIQAEPELINNLGIQIKSKPGEPIMLKQGKGCPKCRKTGYLGRIGIFEVMEVTKEIKELVTESSDVNTLAIRKKALASGMTTLRYDAVNKMLKGITTLQEVARITDF